MCFTVCAFLKQNGEWFHKSKYYTAILRLLVQLLTGLPAVASFKIISIACGRVHGVPSNYELFHAAIIAVTPVAPIAANLSSPPTSLNSVWMENSMHVFVVRRLPQLAFDQRCAF